MGSIHGLSQALHTHTHTDSRTQVNLHKQGFIMLGTFASTVILTGSKQRFDHNLSVHTEVYPTQNIYHTSSIMGKWSVELQV